MVSISTNQKKVFHEPAPIPAGLKPIQKSSITTTMNVIHQAMMSANISII